MQNLASNRSRPGGSWSKAFKRLVWADLVLPGPILLDSGDDAIGHWGIKVQERNKNLLILSAMDQ